MNNLTTEQINKILIALAVFLFCVVIIIVESVKSPEQRAREFNETRREVYHWDAERAMAYEKVERERNIEKALARQRARSN